MDEVEKLQDGERASTSHNHSDLAYRIDERPPWMMTIMMAVQHFSATFSGSLVLPFLLSSSICFDKDPALLTRLIATTFFITGLSTILQIMFGSRLPIIQGPGAGFIIPAIAALSVRGECPAELTANSTQQERDMLKEEAYNRMNELQGSVLVASIIQCLIGFTGLMGIVLRFIGPITIAVTLAMIGIGVFPLIMNLAGKHWCISIPTAALVIFFSKICSKWKIPCLGGKQLRMLEFFPVLLSISIMWIICAILTACDVFPSDSSVYGYAARTDLKTDNLKNTPWISFPYPGQWGWPTFNIAAIVGTLSAIVISVLDSIGDYHACAQVAHVPAPPAHAINRGIGVEGAAGLLASFWGTGMGVVSYSSDIALLNLTKAASRSILIGSGLIFILVGFFTKVSALFNGIPKPILAAGSVTVGMITSIGLSNLSYVKMDSSRNILVVGFSLVVAIGIPQYLGKHPEAIDTGSKSVDNILEGLLLNGMLLGAVISTFLDLVIPGTPEERGSNWREVIETNEENADYKERCSKEGYRVYDFPFGMKTITEQRWTRYFPFSPTFQRDIKVDSDDKPQFELIVSE